MSRWGAWLLLCMLAVAGCGKYPGGGAAAEPSPTPTPAIRSVNIVGQVGLAGRDDASGVQVYIPGTSYVSITGQRGRYFLRDVEPGDYIVQARAEGFETVILGETIVPDDPTTTTIVLPRAVLKPARSAADTTATMPGRIEGEVLLAGATGDLTRCQVELEATAFRTTANRDGAFLLWSIPAGRYTIRARLDDFPPTTASVQVPPGAAVTASLTIRPAEMPSGDRRITGFVEMRGPDGDLTRDYSMVTVHVEGRPDKDAKLGPDGTFTIGGLPPGRYTLEAIAEGYDSAAPTEIDLTGVPEMSVQIRMSAVAGGPAATPAPVASIRGKATKNQQGLTDMSGITVSIAGTSTMATTDAEGNFTLSGVPAGSRRIIAQAEGFVDERVGPFDLAEGQELQLDPIVLEPRINRPRVISTDPAAGSRNVVIDREMPIAIRFNKKMNSDSVRRAVQVTPPVDFRVFTGRDLPTTDFDLTFVTLYGVGNNPARFRTQYRITISAEARDVEGYTMERPFEMMIRTSGPAIIGTIPRQGGITSGAPNDPIIIRFNAPIDPASFTNRALRFTPRISPEPKYSLATEPDSNWSRLSIQATLDPDTPYRVTFGQAIRTINNMPLDNTPYSFSFRTAKQYQYVPPAVPRSVR